MEVDQFIVADEEHEGTEEICFALCCAVRFSTGREVGERGEMGSVGRRPICVRKGCSHLQLQRDVCPIITSAIHPCQRCCDKQSGRLVQVDERSIAKRGIAEREVETCCSRLVGDLWGGTWRDEMGEEEEEARAASTAVISDAVARNRVG
nr:hypothetical protein CFP56_20525 [Quercus suber]